MAALAARVIFSRRDNMAVPAALRASTAGLAATAARRTGHAYAPGVAVVVALGILILLEQQVVLLVVLVVVLGMFFQEEEVLVYLVKDMQDHPDLVVQNTVVEEVVLVALGHEGMVDQEHRHLFLEHQ